MLFVPFLASLSLVLALVDAHDVHLINHKRLIKIRSPQGGIVPPPVAGAGAIPSLPLSESLTSSTVSQTSVSQSTESSSVCLFTFHTSPHF